MARKKKIVDAVPQEVVVAAPVEEVAPAMEAGDAIHQMSKDMIHLQEAVTEALALVSGCKVVNSRPLTLSIPTNTAKSKGLPCSVVCPEMLHPVDRVEHARKLGVDLKTVIKSPLAWKHLYNVDV